jgi:hypothetical protein
MVMSRDQNAGRIHSARLDNSTFDKVEEFKYLGKNLTNQNFIAEEIKSRLSQETLAIIRCGIFCLHRLLSKHLKIKVYRTIILPIILYGCETWSLTLREERKLRLFENMVLRRIFGPWREEVKGEWRRLHNEELNDLYTTEYCAGDKMEKNEMGWACGAYG